MRSFKILVFLSATTMLSACGTLLSGQTQEVELRTPGAYDVQCTLDNGTRYRAATGDKLIIMRSQKPLEVDCYAPGNRHLVKTIDRDLNDWSIANISNGIVPGVTYDHFSNGLYEYPKVISVDFTGMPSPGFEKPEYDNRDVPDPKLQAMEAYTPAMPKIQSDDSYLKRGVEKVDQNLMSNPFAGTDISAVPGAKATTTTTTTVVTPTPATAAAKTTTTTTVKTTGTPAPALKGSNAEDLNHSMNPTVFNK